MKKIIIKVVLSLVLLGSVAALSVGFISRNNKMAMEEKVYVDVIYENIFVENVDIGNLTKEEAIIKLNNEISEPNLQKVIKLNFEDTSYDYTFKDFDYSYNIEEVVNEAYDYAKDGELKDRFNLINNLVDEPKHYTLSTSYNDKKASSILENIKTEVYKEPINASITRVNGDFTVTDSTDGFELDLDENAEKILNSLENNESATIDLVTKTVLADYNATDLQQAQDLIGSSVSNYSGRTTNRGINMENASNKINNIVVYPGEVFSTNEALGEMTFDNGYRVSQAIIDGELVDDIGGGVCQISSTLYNAILKAELEIVQRRNHSQKVGYMDWGFDATLYIGVVDLMFKNDTDLPIIIESYMTNSQVIVNIYGKEIHSPSRRLEFTNALVTTTKPQAEQITYSSSLPSGQRNVKVSALTGYVYDVYKFVYENDQLIEKVHVNRSTYKPRRAQVIVGTGTTGAQTPAASKPTVTEPAAPVEPPIPTEPITPVEPTPTAPVETAPTEPVTPVVPTPTEPVTPVEPAPTEPVIDSPLE